MAKKDQATADVTLEMDVREETGSGPNRRMRKAGMVPCILYGLGEKNAPLSIALSRLEIVLGTGKRMVDIHFGQKKETVLLKDLQHDPMTDKIIHADFERVAMDEEIEIEIPIVLKGRCKGHEEGGIIDHIMKALNVRCLPKDIPEEVMVEITDLDINDSCKVSDIPVPSGVTVIADADEMVVVIHQPAREEEALPEDDADLAAGPEVITAAEPKPDAEAGDAAEPKEEKKE